jgi:hypothetical protein
MGTLKVPMSVPAPQRPARRGLFARLRRARDEADAAWLEEARRRMRSQPNYFASLTPDLLEALRQGDGIDIMGGPARKRSDL